MFQALCLRNLLQVQPSVVRKSCCSSKAVLRTLHATLSSAEAPKPNIKEDKEESHTEQNVGLSHGAKITSFPDEKYRSNEVGATNEHGSTHPVAAESDLKEFEVENWTWKQLPGIYLKLSKSRLTALVVLTALGGYSAAPAPFVLSALLYTSAGTALCSAAANSFNQWLEVPFDSLMTRTKNRVLVRRKISAHHAAMFGVVSATCGTLVLYHFVNPLTAALGFANIFLYAGVYTPLKRVSIVNTWVGSIVGAIPPLMGWAACTGSLSSGALVLAGILYAWQFAHFNALSWGLRADYSRAGYRMMSVSHPALCKRVALRYSLATIPICTLAPWCDLTTWFFALDSLPVNAWLVYLAWKFHQDSDAKSARRLFRYTLLHLPLLMALLLINKKHWHSKDKVNRTQ